MLVLACIGGALLTSMSGCADEGEGERCTYFPGGDAGTNGSTECAAGLLCTPNNYYTPATTLTGVGTLGLCCPPPGTAASVTACEPQYSGSSTAGPPAGDGGFDGQVNDAKADVRTDAKKDGPEDAKKDASMEAGASMDATTKDGTTKDAGASMDATTKDGTTKDAGSTPPDAGKDAPG
jgi:hypothetical protein